MNPELEAELKAITWQPKETLTDSGNARRFVAQHGDKIRFNGATGKWMEYDGSRFLTDPDGSIMRRAKSTARSLYAEAAEAPDESVRRRIARFAMQSENEPRLRAMISLAQSEPGVTVRADEFDSDPDLLACPNCTIDLRTGKPRPANPADLITMRTEVEFDPEATSELWLKTLLEIFEGDVELVAFLQRFVGYALTGHTNEHVFAIFYGPLGRNGKSLITERLRKLLGDLATTSDFETFIRARGDRGPRNDLAALRGARLVTAAEATAGRRLDEATIKQLTGGDKITARFLYNEPFEFYPGFKLLLITNHRPRIDGSDEAIWARVREIPFNVSFKGREDRNLEKKLDEELPGILNWAIEGCLQWRKYGLGTAPAIDQSTAAYRSEEDLLGTFLTEMCESGGEVLATRLRAEYERFCEDAGEEPLATNRLGKELATRGITRGGAKRRFYRGVSIK
jgi:putative DNA primase/helicase